VSAELKALRAIALAAMSSFEARGIAHLGLKPADILHEALLCAQSDIDVIGSACHTGLGAVDSMVFRRAELRIDLAIALAEYCGKFGWPQRATGEETEVTP
jgi:hypothetical protein